MNLLEVRDLHLDLGGQPVLRGLNFTVQPAEILALLGPSGSGKTSTLRALAGFERPARGEVRLSGRPLVAPGVFVPPEQRRMGYVFQEYALFPHLTVAQNVAFGLRGLARGERERRVAEWLDRVGLSAFAGRFPHELSGGQQQRVALARALAPRPGLILLDEPFSGLDAALRESTREHVRKLLKEEETAAILVTHDQEEALSLADRVAILNGGRIEQLGSPREVYALPANPFVARFIGHTNLLRGTARGDHAETPLGPARITPSATGPVILSVRPEHLELGGEGVEARVVELQFKGHDLTLWVEAASGRYRVQADYRLPYRPGDRVRVRVREPAVVVDVLGGERV